MLNQQTWSSLIDLCRRHEDQCLISAGDMKLTAWSLQETWRSMLDLCSRHEDHCLIYAWDMKINAWYLCSRHEDQYLISAGDMKINAWSLQQTWSSLLDLCSRHEDQCLIPRLTNHKKSSNFWAFCLKKMKLQSRFRYYLIDLGQNIENCNAQNP